MREKASEDFDRIVKGTSKTREKLGVRNMMSSNASCLAWFRFTSFGFQVLEEIFTYWNLEDVDDELEELEDALIVRLIF